MSKKILRMVFLLLIFGLAACGGSGTTSTPSPTVTADVTATQSSPTPVIHSTLVGRYTLVVTSKDFDPDSPLAFNISTGTWVLDFRPDGGIIGQDGNYLTLAATYVVLGQYTVHGNQFTMYDTKCWEFWGDNAKTATYSWTLQGNTLLLKSIGNDGCPGRSLLFSHPWTRQG
jgi:predicted small lipoprotein YifL